MVSVILDCKIEYEGPQDLGPHIENGLRHELKIISQHLSDKATKIIKERSRLKIYDEKSMLIV